MVPFNLPFFTGNSVMDVFFLAGILMVASSILPLLLQRYPAAAHTTAMILSASGSLVGIISAVMALFAKSPCSFSTPWATAGIQLSLNIDGLAAFFLLPIFVLGFTAAIYGYSYLQHDIHQVQKISFHWFFFNILMLSMAAVVTAGNGMEFLVAWEGMSISSFFLVCYNFNDEEVCRNGWQYFIATHIGVAFLFFFFLTASYQCGSLDFASFGALKSLSPVMTGVMFCLILVGFGSKAGLFPMHVWLPGAHPSAPSHVSALMSGVMIKTAVYGFLRMLTLLPPLPGWCVTVLLSISLIGTIFGITMAVSQNDIKRSLAYSTVENINLIFVGIGLWLLGVNAGWPIMASIALTGALLHVWNHALFKGLLFMGAGSILHSTGSRLFSHFGGLMRRMPISGVMIMFGSAAIAGLPPLNGFVSELYLYMSVVIMGQKASGMTAFSALLILALMILVGGLVLFTVCRLTGMALLGEPREPEAKQAVESAPLMLFAMSALCALCILFGVAPFIPLSAVAKPLQVLSVVPDISLNVLPFLLSWQWTAASGSLLLLFMLFLWMRTRSVGDTPRSVTWGCGFQKPNSRMVYSAGGFTQLAQDTLFCSCVSPTNEPISPLGLFGKPFRFIQNNSDPVLRRLFIPLFSGFAARANRFHRLQAGRLNIYLLYTFIATILLLGLDIFHN